jgi:predicted AAA+ superfamily ATPase
MKEYIPRIVENEIQRYLRQFPVVGILGPRQVGKTTLARHLAGQINRPTLYLDLEYPEDLNSLRTR